MTSILTLKKPLNKTRTTLKQKRKITTDKRLHKEAVERQAEKRTECLKWLKKTFWAFRQYRPLQTGTLKKALALKPDDMVGIDLRRAIKYHCNSRKYHANIITMEYRFTIKVKRRMKK